MASIVDKPKSSSQIDLLEIEKYTNGLVKFIESSSTPMTIGIQGEWGSGKTSLLYTIQEELCFREKSKYHSIWINTWEYSLLSDADETIVKIIVGMIEQISRINSSMTNESMKKLLSISKYLLDKATIAGGAIGMAANLAADAVDGVANTRSSNSVKELRETLQQAIDKTLANSDKEAFIFFIDDLDRLDPIIAVNILELIKNIFDIHNCVFVLAIDYGVVVKGLKSKFGEMTEQNEWEFRAFFDKIIQLPFSMPMANYNISKYLQNILADVNYFDKQTLANESVINKVSEVVNLSIGTNPRSLKRLANSVSLIDIIRGDNDISTQDKIIEFALICMQIAYPSIYSFIQRESDFTSWNERMTQNIIKNMNIDVKDLEVFADLEEFDEVWEQNLWKMCQVSTFLRDRAFLVSRLLNFIRTNVILQNNETLGDAIERLLSMSSVTSVSVELKVKKVAQAKGIYYINVGESENRSWNDCIKYNFIVAGGGERWSNAIKKCRIGDIVVLYLKGKGYVGVGRVQQHAVQSFKFKYNDELLNESMLEAPLMLTEHENSDDDEWLVEVDWIKSVTAERSKWKAKSNLYTTPLVRASLENQPETIEFINKEFEVDLLSLLNKS